MNENQTVMARGSAAGPRRTEVVGGIGVAVLIAAFLLIMDVGQNGQITWSFWPLVAAIFFGVGFTLLNRFGREPPS